MQDIIAAHRRTLADALSTLTAAQWRAPSLCAGWTAAHVLADQTMPFRISEQDFMAGLQRRGGDFTTFSDEVADRDSRLPPAELVAVLRDNAGTPWSPPGGGLTGALCHDVIHGLDISWPQGLAYEIPAQAAKAVLDSLSGSGSRTLFGFPLDGIRVAATDLDWSAGQGAELTGRSRDLLPLLAGRAVPHEFFDGAGAARAWSLAAR
ncbi:MAG: maleylpyruvate isomerase family mycothiol-dependent enzyme [Streptosporangiaceae bacterium]